MLDFSCEDMVLNKHLEVGKGLRLNLRLEVRRPTRKERLVGGEAAKNWDKHLPLYKRILSYPLDFGRMMWVKHCLIAYGGLRPSSARPDVVTSVYPNFV